MSYDICLFHPVPGESPKITAARDESPRQALSQHGRARNQRLGDALRQIYPGTEVIELDEETEFVLESAGMTVFIAERDGVINIAYWQSNQSAHIVALIDAVLAAIVAETGFLAFDRQSEQVLTPGLEPAVHAGLFDGGVAAVHSAPAGRQRWWKFWQG